MGEVISTQNLAPLPDIPAMRRLTQSLAMLDAILCPEWDLRYYSFNSCWAAGEMMASMRNGSGDEWFLLFDDAGAAMKGFAHETLMAAGSPWPGVLSDVPSAFSRFLNEPAFSLEDTTFCLWRSPFNNQWQKGKVAYLLGDDPDGSADLLFILDGRPRTYQQWAEEYYGVEVSIAAVEHIYQHRFLTPEVIASLNEQVTLGSLAEDLEETGYPTQAER